jgi:tetraacyldisaccharide 4'-kinase
VNRAAVERWLARRWYGEVAPGPLLRAASGVFGTLAGLRRRAYARGWLRSERLPVPVLVVGNVAVGGSGKTPMAIALVEALRARGWRPGVVSRGYGGRERGPLRLPLSPDPMRFGDEPCLIARRTGVPVAVARRRAQAGRLLLESGEIDLVIADDGLQHYALARDVEVVMVDGRRRFGNRMLLPAGPLREPPSRVEAAQFVVVAGGEAGQGEVPMALQLSDPESMRDGAVRPLHGLVATPVHAVAGIADPERFFDALRGEGLEPAPHAFPDHHAYREDDFAFDDGRPLLMTEKDAIKCAGFAGAHWYSVPLRAAIPASFFDAVDAALRTARSKEHR